MADDDLVPVGPDDEPEPERLLHLSSDERLRERQSATERLARSKEGEILAQILEEIQNDAFDRICRPDCPDTDFQRGRVDAVKTLITALELPGTILRNRRAREARGEAKNDALRRLRREARTIGIQGQGLV